MTFSRTEVQILTVNKSNIWLWRWLRFDHYFFTDYLLVHFAKI